MSRYRRIIAGIVIGLFVGAAVIGIFGSLLPDTIQDFVVQIETVAPAGIALGGVAVVLAGVGGYYLREGSGKQTSPSPLVDQEHPPEDPRQPPAQVGSDFDTAVREAARDVRVKQVPPTETQPYSRLQSTVREIIRKSRNPSDSTAEQLIQSGDWTDNTVAQAFLSEQIDYPVAFQLLQWARPELAFRRAVSHSVEALQALAETELSNYHPRGGTDNSRMEYRGADVFRQIFSNTNLSETTDLQSGNERVGTPQSGLTERAGGQRNSADVTVTPDSQGPETSTEGQGNV